MNFFEQQDRAKRNTSHLVALFGLAVVSLVALTTLVVTLLLYFFGGNSAQYVEYANAGMLQRIDWTLAGGIAVVIIAVVLLGSLYKSLQLSRGGPAVAELLGGRQINVGARDADERKILNVVEEMAIASGTPVPPVYVLEDDAINAFAAGLTPQDAVIGITRGCIRLLSRDELQGVVAHEFSHIFHGDMRLNTRLVSLLHGILVIGLIGQILLRSSSGRQHRSSDKNNSAGAVLAIGAALAVIGYVGTFFGNLIKAAVSRQREFLADASAVQFTRNPDSIAGALKKIGGYPLSSQLSASHAAEFSHMFFGQGVQSALSSMMATHPPLEERIRRIEPGWDGRFPQVRLEQPAAAEERATPPPVGDSWNAAFAALGGTAGVAAAAEQAIAAIGEPKAEHLAYARQTLGALDDQLRDAAHVPYSARALIYGLLLSQDEQTREAQLRLLEGNGAADAAGLLAGLDDKLRNLDERFRLPLIELTLPTLKQLSPEQYATFKKCLILLIRADQHISLMEWALYRILVHNLEKPAKVTHRYKLEQLPEDVGLLLSMLARAGHDDERETRAAIAAAVSMLPFAVPTTGAAPETRALDAALSRLNQLQPLQKPQLLKAMARCIVHDGKVATAEAELFRAVADVLDCPMPPLLLGEEARLG